MTLNKEKELPILWELVHGARGKMVHGRAPEENRRIEVFRRGDAVRSFEER